METTNTRSTSETGHITNLNALEKMYKKAAALGARYQPSNPAISVDSLKVLYTTALTASQDLRDTEAPLIKARGERRVALKDVKTKATRIINLLSTSADVVPAILTNAAGINRKIQGASLSGKNTKPAAGAADSDNPTPATVSTSQQSFGFLVQHYQELLSLLKQTPAYKPAEEGMSIEEIEKFIGLMQEHNSLVDQVSIPFEEAKSRRNRIFYGDDTGIIATAKKVKAYLKGVYPTSSEEYRAWNAIPFRKLR